MLVLLEHLLGSPTTSRHKKVEDGWTDKPDILCPSRQSLTAWRAYALEAKLTSLKIPPTLDLLGELALPLRNGALPMVPRHLRTCIQFDTTVLRRVG